jgi:hypothetical protein
VLVLQVFSLPLSSSKEISDSYLGKKQNTPVQKVEAHSYAYINYMLRICNNYPLILLIPIRFSALCS